ncbi:hypothetical protein KBD18_02525 [Patescibacteria group bacterium]|nr:hypothetical protein [Patescibacteria group bacterium]
MSFDPLAVSLEPTPTPQKEVLSETQVTSLKMVLQALQTNVQSALQILEAQETPKDIHPLITTPTPPSVVSGQRVVEGMFDGQKMFGDDGQPYSMAQNYASKSKLVVGDRLKLIITGSGNFLFKQIGPVERRRVVGILAKELDASQFVVVKGDERWKVLTASVTYFHGDPGDEAVVLVPVHGTASWAAVENIVKKTF